MVCHGSQDAYELSLTSVQVLFKRKPIKLEPLPKFLDDNTEVRSCDPHNPKDIN